jgi:hypothetical protein
VWLNLLAYLALPASLLLPVCVFFPGVNRFPACILLLHACLRISINDCLLAYLPACLPACFCLPASVAHFPLPTCLLASVWLPVSLPLPASFCLPQHDCLCLESICFLPYIYLCIRARLCLRASPAYHYLWFACVYLQASNLLLSVSLCLPASLPSPCFCVHVLTSLTVLPCFFFFFFFGCLTTSVSACTVCFFLPLPESLPACLPASADYSFLTACLCVCLKAPACLHDCLHPPAWIHLPVCMCLPASACVTQPACYLCVAAWLMPVPLYLLVCLHLPTYQNLPLCMISSACIPGTASLLT